MEDKVSKSSETPKSVLKSMLLKLLRLFVLIYLSLCFAIYFLQDGMVFIPTVGAPESTPKDLAYHYENLQLSSGDETINAWYVPSSKDRGTLLFCHGNAGT
jgi:uncharacterized protein